MRASHSHPDAGKAMNTFSESHGRELKTAGIGPPEVNETITA